MTKRYSIKCKYCDGKYKSGTGMSAHVRAKHTDVPELRPSAFINHEQFDTWVEELHKADSSDVMKKLKQLENRMMNIYLSILLFNALLFLILLFAILAN